mmetsp:Transcript_26843/g.63072  ORF Transcript_26843/g.63072 Transcript_26843/m.63072 type:complete len:184 (+) Transcript_26843:481-1032(+)
MYGTGSIEDLETFDDVADEESLGATVDGSFCSEYVMGADFFRPSALSHGACDQLRANRLARRNNTAFLRRRPDGSLSARPVRAVACLCDLWPQFIHLPAEPHEKWIQRGNVSGPVDQTARRCRNPCWITLARTAPGVCVFCMITKKCDSEFVSRKTATFYRDQSLVRKRSISNAVYQMKCDDL